MSSIRCYPFGHDVRLVEKQGEHEICFDIGYDEIEAHIFLSLDGIELRRVKPRKIHGFKKKVRALRNLYSIQVELLDYDCFQLPNGCQLECHQLANALQWELRTPTGLILALPFDPTYDSQTGDQDTYFYELTNNCFLLENCGDVESVIVVKASCPLEQWTSEIDFLLSPTDRGRLVTWMIIAKRLGLDLEVARRIAYEIYS